MIDELFDNYGEINTERLKLRRITAADVNDIFEIFSDREVMLWYDDRFAFESISEAEEMIKQFNDGIDERRSLRWGIEYDGRLAGTCGFHCLSEYHRRAEIGYDLNRDYWGRGIMTEALKGIIGYAFDVSELNRIEAYVEPPNTASRKLLERIGFTYEGTLRQHEMCRGEIIDIVILSLLRDDMP